VIRRLGIALTLVLVTGCAFIARSRVDRLSRQIDAYERLAPDAESLGRGDVQPTTDAVRQMGQWADHIEQQDLPPVERQRLVDRLAAARHRYLLAAARLADTPDLGYALARTALTADDPDALALVRELSDKRAKRRQELFATAHTYELDLGDDPVWKTTSSGMAVVDGQVVAQHSTAELVERPGNCVFATRAFPAEGKPNPGLTFRLVGRHAFYLRCYVRRDPAGLPRADGTWVVGVSAGTFDVKGLTPAHSSQRYRDFLITPAADGASRGEFAHLQVDLSYDYSDGFEVVWDEQGVRRLQKRMRTVQLAGSPVFWERDDGAGGADGAVADRHR